MHLSSELTVLTNSLIFTSGLNRFQGRKTILSYSQSMHVVMIQITIHASHSENNVQYIKSMCTYVYVCSACSMITAAPTHVHPHLHRPSFILGRLCLFGRKCSVIG